MRSDRETQIQFFDWLKANSNSDQLVTILEELLSTSRDSVYRRMRGETLLSFNEISKISQHFNISLDSYLNLTTKAVTFQSRVIEGNFTFTKYLQSIAENLQMIRKFEDHELLYMAKDIPLFYYFQFPRLAAFKLFFWSKTIVGVPDLEDKLFDLAEISDEMLSQSKSIWHQFEQIPSTEIWSNETINISISQINYYLESHIISEGDAQIIVQEFKMLMDHIKVQAAQGKKFTQGTDPKLTSDKGKFLLYFNEVEIGDNTILFKMDDKRIVFKPFNTLNTISTTDPDFCQQTESYFYRVISKSTPLSNSSEKERLRFFNRTQLKIKDLERKVGL